MVRGWGKMVRGWGGDGDSWCGDGVGTGTRFVMWDGNGDQIPSPCHSLLHTNCKSIQHRNHHFTITTSQTFAAEIDTEHVGKFLHENVRHLDTRNDDLQVWWCHHRRNVTDMHTAMHSHQMYTFRSVAQHQIHLLTCLHYGASKRTLHYSPSSCSITTM